jgi:hypothetical protein
MSGLQVNRCGARHGASPDARKWWTAFTSDGIRNCIRRQLRWHDVRRYRSGSIVVRCRGARYKVKRNVLLEGFARSGARIAVASTPRRLQDQARI